VIGLGDHVPDFLLRSVKSRARAAREPVEAEEQRRSRAPADPLAFGVSNSAFRPAASAHAFPNGRRGDINKLMIDIGRKAK
jgi:hypothetical protein